jgi:hypothetical protein
MWRPGRSAQHAPRCGRGASWRTSSPTVCCYCGAGCARRLHHHCLHRACRACVRARARRCAHLQGAPARGAALGGAARPACARALPLPPPPPPPLRRALLARTAARSPPPCAACGGWRALRHPGRWALHARRCGRCPPWRTCCPAAYRRCGAGWARRCARRPRHPTRRHRPHRGRTHRRARQAGGLLAHASVHGSAAQRALAPPPPLPPPTPMPLPRAPTHPRRPCRLRRGRTRWRARQARGHLTHVSVPGNAAPPAYAPPPPPPAPPPPPCALMRPLAAAHRPAARKHRGRQPRLVRMLLHLQAARLVAAGGAAAAAKLRRRTVRRAAKQHVRWSVSHARRFPLPEVRMRARSVAGRDGGPRGAHARVGADGSEGAPAGARRRVNCVGVHCLDHVYMRGM